MKRKPASRSVIRQALTLAAFAAAATLVVETVQRLTSEQAGLNRDADELRLLAEVLPADFDNEPLKEKVLYRNPELLGSTTALPVYTARRDGQVLGRAITVVAADGYVAPIRLLIGIDPAGQIIAVRVLEHRETPGLGDRIEAGKSAWIHQLRGKSLQDDPNSWRVRREGGDFDQLSGATVTSSAVLRAVAAGLEFAATVPADAAANQLPATD